MACPAPIIKKFVLQCNTEFNEHPTNGLVSGQGRTDGRMYEHGHHHIWRSFLEVFAKLRKATISLIVSVSPSVRMEQLSSYRTDFRQI